MNPFLRSISLSVAGSTLLFQPFAKADVSYQETTQINGGSMTDVLKMVSSFSSQAKQLSGPITSSVMIHNNRMVKTNPRTTQIIDLDQQMITNIDNQKHTYYTITFEQMRQGMAKAASKAADAPKQTGGDAANQLKFNAHISRSGATRELDGKTAKEALLTVTMLGTADDGSNAKAGMAATSEMWMIDSAPGMDELRAFNKRMASELGVESGNSPLAGVLAGNPGAAQALADLRKEATAMSGMPVLQITRVGFSADGQPLPAPSVMPLPASTKGDGSGKAGEMTRDLATDAGTQTASSQLSRLGAFGSVLGGTGLGALARHKSAPKTPTHDDPAAAAHSAAAAILLETQTTLSNFSTSVANLGGFEIPAGYKQVTSPMR